MLAHWILFTSIGFLCYYNSSAQPESKAITKWEEPSNERDQKFINPPRSPFSGYNKISRFHGAYTGRQPPMSDYIFHPKPMRPYRLPIKYFNDPFRPSDARPDSNPPNLYFEESFHSGRPPLRSPSRSRSLKYGTLIRDENPHLGHFQNYDAEFLSPEDQSGDKTDDSDTNQNTKREADQGSKKVKKPR